MNSKHSSSLQNPYEIGVDNGMSNLGEAGGRNVTKPCGRPRGSKNKPKGNVLNVTPTIEFPVLEIPSGVDIIEWLGQYSQSKKVYVNVIGGFGLLSEVAVRLGSQPDLVIFCEPITLMSLAGFSCKFSPSEPVSCSYTATLGRLNGTAIGGTVYRLITRAPVVLTAMLSNDAEFIGNASKSLA